MDAPLFADILIDMMIKFANGGVTPLIPNTGSTQLIYSAVSLGFRQNASNKAYTAKLSKTGQFEFDSKTSYEAMNKQADRWAQLALYSTLPVVVPIPAPVLPPLQPNPDNANTISPTPTPTSVMEYW